MSKLESQLARLDRVQTAANARSLAMQKSMAAGLAGSNMPVMLNGPLRQMDDLTKRIQKGTISQKEFMQSIRGTNGLMEYQNRLAKANLETFRKVGAGKGVGALNLPELRAGSTQLQRTAQDWKTAEMAAKSYGRTVSNQGKNMAFMGRQSLLSITAPIAAIAAVTATVFFGVDKQLTNIVKVYGDSADAVQASNADIKEASMNMAKTLNNSFGVAVKDTLNLVSAFAALGESGKNLDDMTTQAARLMVLGDVSEENATKMISTLRNVFQLEGGKLKEAIDFANEMENSTTLQMKDFADALPKIGPIVESWGGDVRQAGQILEGFTRSGINAVEGANALKSGFAKLARTTPQLRAMFDDMSGGMAGGLDKIVADAKGNVPEILKQIGKIQEAQKWSDPDKQKFAAQLWGAQQLARGMVLTKNLSTNTERVEGIMKKSSAELAAIADAEIKSIMDSASKRFSVALQNAKLFAAKIGERVLPVITTVLEKLLKIGETIGGMFSALRDGLGPLGNFGEKMLMFGVGALAMLGPIMLMVAAVKMIKGTLISGWGAMAGRISNIKSNGISPTFSTAQQKANALASQAAADAKLKEGTATQQLQRSIDNLTQSYLRQAAAQKAAMGGAVMSAARMSNAAQNNADAQRAMYVNTLNQARQTQNATNATTRAIHNQTVAIGSQTSSLRTQYSLVQNGIANNRQQSRQGTASVNGLMPDRYTRTNNAQWMGTLTSPNGGQWQRNSRGEVARLGADGTRSPVSPASVAHINNRFATASAAAANAGRYSQDYRGAVPTAPVPASARETVNRMVSANPQSSAIAAIPLALRSATQAAAPLNARLAQAALNGNSLTGAARGMAASYSSVADRAKLLNQYQARANQLVVSNGVAQRAAQQAAARAAALNNPASRGTGISAGNTSYQDRKNQVWANARARMATGAGVAVPNGPRTQATIAAGGTPQMGLLQQQNVKAAEEVAKKTAAAAAAQERFRERTAAAGSQMGMMLTTAGMLTSMLGGTSKTMQQVAMGATAIGMILMTFPGLMTKIAVAAKAMTASMNASTGGFFAKAGSQAKKFGSALLSPWTAVAAGVGVAAYVVYRNMTREARALTEENNKIGDSIKGWTKVLGLAPTEFGQIVNSQGEAVDTIASLIEKAKNDENVGALIDRLKRNADNYNVVRDNLEREALKLAARGVDKDTIQKSLDIAMKAANLDVSTQAKLTVEFTDIDLTGLGKGNLSTGIKEQMDAITRRTDENATSGWQNFIQPIPFVGEANGDDLYDPKNMMGQQTLAKLKDLRDAMDAQMLESNPETRAKIINAWTKGWLDSFDQGLDMLSDEARKYIRDRGGPQNINPMDMYAQGLITMDQVDQVDYQKNMARDVLGNMKNKYGNNSTVSDLMFRDFNSASVSANYNNPDPTILMSGAKAAQQYKDKIAELGDEWKNLSDEEKVQIINQYRTAAGYSLIEKDAQGAAIAAGDLGPEIYKAGTEAERAAAKAEELAAQFGEGRTADWNIEVSISTPDGGVMNFASVDDFVESQKNMFSKVAQDVEADMKEQFDRNKAAQDRAREAEQQAESDALSDRQKAEEKAFSKSQKLEEKNFDKSWKDRIEGEKKGFDDRIKAIEDTQEAEDDLERDRKRNADREQRRLKYLQSLMQSNIDYNTAMAGGNLDEAARISVNAATSSIDYTNETNDAEAGYKKEDEDKARSKLIDTIKAEQDERLKALDAMQEAERDALTERLEMQAEEFAKKQEAEQRYLQQKQAAADLQAEQEFQTQQRLMNRELEVLRAAIPTNEAEMNAHMGRMAELYNKYGGNLTQQGDGWAVAIRDSLGLRMEEARVAMANENAWRDYGNRVAEGASQGAFNMTSDEFNKFLRTGELPASKQYGPTLQETGLPQYRHTGGPIGGGYDKYNNRGGRSMKAGLGRDEHPIIAQSGEFMMKKKAVNTYGTDVMHSINNGTFNPNNTGGAVVTNMNAIGGFGEFGAAMAAITMGSIISRAVVAAGSAMMAATSGGGDIGAINIPQRAGTYGNTMLNDTQLRTAALIAEASKEVGASKRDLTIALMTAFQESSMGTAGMYVAVDHDSLGPFQQRAAWGPAADRTDVKKSTKMFYYGGQQGQRGLFDFPNRNGMGLGQAAQAVQVSDNPGAYDQWRDEAEAIIAAGVGTDISRTELAKNLRFGNWTTAGIQAYAAKFANSAVGSGGPMNVQPGEYQHPVPGAPMTSGFGMRWGSMHEGIDFGAPSGTPIYATKAGVVTLASDRGDGFGNHIVINHGGGITSGYAHQSRFASRVGDQVAKGQNIGYVGNTGQSTGPHLHFQLGRGQDGGRYGYTTDPAQFGIPGLRVGGIVGYDNTIANLHKDEAVLTAPLSKSLQNGINNLESGTGSSYSFEFNVNAPVYGVDDLQKVLSGWKEEVINEVDKRKLTKDRRTGRATK